MSPLPRSTAPSIALRSAPVRSSKKPEMGAGGGGGDDGCCSVTGWSFGWQAVAPCLPPSFALSVRPRARLCICLKAGDDDASHALLRLPIASEH